PCHDHAARRVGLLWHIHARRQEAHLLLPVQPAPVIVLLRPAPTAAQPGRFLLTRSSPMPGMYAPQAALPSRTGTWPPGGLAQRQLATTNTHSEHGAMASGRSTPGRQGRARSVAGSR